MHKQYRITQSIVVKDLQPLRCFGNAGERLIQSRIGADPLRPFRHLCLQSLLLFPTLESVKVSLASYYTILAQVKVLLVLVVVEFLGFP